MKLSIFQNPIIIHSLRSRRANWRIITASVLAFLSYGPACLIFGSYILTQLVFDADLKNFVRDLDEVGAVIFYVTAVFLLLIVTLFAPAMAASTIAGEKQRQTLDLLLVTLLPTRSIIVGKLLSALVYTLLLIAVVWPLILFCLFLGGVDLVELLVAGILLIVTSLAFTTVGLFTSSLSRTTTNATMLTYGVALPTLLIGPFLAMLPVTITLLLADVGYNFLGVVNFYGWSLAASLNPLSAAIYSGILRADEGGWILVERVISLDSHYLLYPWVIYVIFYGFLTFFLVQLTMWRLEKMGG
jgi:ABC-type transport system involved in multi-copper enzyme maturation permease subunit